MSGTPLIKLSVVLIFDKFRSRERKIIKIDELSTVKTQLQQGAAYSYTRIVRFHAKTHVSLRKNLRI